MSPTRSFAEDALPNGLASHQLEALTWLRGRPVGLLADATGSGKTAVAAATIAYAFDEEGARRALWVTEASLVTQAVLELRRFLPSFQVDAWPGQAADHIKVISVETLTRHVERVLRFGPDVGVVDDAAVKGQGPEPAAVSRVMNGPFRRLGLNATPVELDATEAYRILRLLGAPDLPDQSVFDSYMQWQALPFGEERPYATRPDAVAVVRAVFSRYVLRRGPEELGLALPQVQDEIVWVQLTDPQRTAYRLADDERTPMLQSLKRESACAFALGRSAKAEAAVATLVANPALTKVVIFSEYLQHLSITERLLDRFGIRWVRIDGPRSKKRRAEALDAFRHDPRVRVLLATRVLERGLDGLQHCGVMFSLGASFNPAREAQRIGRLARPGSPHAGVRHITFATDTGHERTKHQTLQRRRLEAVALIHGLTGIQQQEEPEMDLTRDQINLLRASRGWLRKRQQPYGRPLEEVVRDASEMEFLLDAVDAGHVPEFEGIKIALQAYCLLAESGARRHVEAGKRAWAADDLYGTASELRALASVLLTDADGLEAIGPEIGVTAAEAS